MFLIIHAGLMSLPPDVMNAAKVDGASGWNQLRHITLPLLRGIIGVAIIFRTMDAFKTFDVPFTLNLGGPGAPVGGTTTISILAYQMMLRYHRIGDAAAIVIVLLICLNLIIPRLIKYLKV
jgi:multiple sugar transport system permease protein